MTRKLEIEKLVIGQMEVNCYICTDSESKTAVIIDPGDEAPYISDYLEKHTLRPTAILATHGHFDHIMAAFALQHMYRIPFLIHSADAFLVGQMQHSARHFLGISTTDPPPHIDKTVDENDSISIGNKRIKLIHTPGHTPGSVSFVLQKTLIVGDVLFRGGSIGRTDFSYSNYDDLKSSLRKILSHVSDTVIYPGHGPATRVGDEQSILEN